MNVTTLEHAARLGEGLRRFYPDLWIDLQQNRVNFCIGSTRAVRVKLAGKETIDFKKCVTEPKSHGKALALSEAEFCALVREQIDAFYVTA